MLPPTIGVEDQRPDIHLLIPSILETNAPVLKDNPQVALIAILHALLVGVQIQTNVMLAIRLQIMSLMA